MKKTLVAIAAVAAVTGAMADVTISGFIDQAVQTTSTTLAAGTKSTINSVGNNLSGQDQLSFNASEDLGDGMTAYGTYNIQPTIGTNGNSGNLTDVGSGIGIKGAFGNLFIGTVYDQVFLTMAAADVTGFGATNGVGSVWAATNGVGANAKSVVYTLPTLVEGLTITAENAYGGVATGVGDSFGYSVAYTTGALFVKFASTQVKTSSGVTAFSSTDGAAVATISSLFDGSIATYSALAATYDLGSAKLFYGNEKMSMNNSGDAAESKYTAGVSVPFGAASLGYARSSAQFTNAAATKLNEINSDAIVAKYSFSKRTLAYLKAAKSTTSSTSASISNTSCGSDPSWYCL